MIVKDVQPLWVSSYNPAYILPSRTHFTSLIEQKYGDKKQSKGMHTPNANTCFRNNLDFNTNR